jgi:hypothetical protein
MDTTSSSSFTGTEASSRRYPEAIESDAREVAEEVIQLVDETNQFVRGQMIVRPYVTLGTAAGVGYLLGAGIPRWAARMAIAFFARTIASYVYSSGSLRGEGSDRHKERTQ